MFGMSRAPVQLGDPMIHSSLHFPLQKYIIKKCCYQGRKLLKKHIKLFMWHKRCSKQFGLIAEPKLALECFMKVVSKFIPRSNTRTPVRLDRDPHQGNSWGLATLGHLFPRHVTKDRAGRQTQRTSTCTAMIQTEG